MRNLDQIRDIFRDKPHMMVLIFNVLSATNSGIILDYFCAKKKDLWLTMVRNESHIHMWRRKKRRTLVRSRHYECNLALIY